MLYASVSSGAGRFSFSTMILVAYLLIAGITQVNGTTSNLNVQQMTDAIKDEYAVNNGIDIVSRHQGKLIELQNTEQENEDIVAIAQAYEGYEETLAREQEMLSNDPYTSTAEDVEDEAEYDNEESEEKQVETEYFHENTRDQMQKREKEQEDSEEQQVENEEQQVEVVNNQEAAEYHKNAEDQLEKTEDEQDEAEGPQGEAEDHRAEVNELQEEAGEQQEEEKVKAEDQNDKTDEEQHFETDKVLANARSYETAEDEQNVESECEDMPKDHKRTGQCLKLNKLFEKMKRKGKLSNTGSTIKFRKNSGRTVYIKDLYPIPKYNNFRIRSAQFDCSTNSLSISAETAAKWTIIPNYLTLRRVTVLINVKTNDPQKSLKAVMNGYWRIGNLDVKTTLTFNLATKTTHIVVQPSPGTSLTSFVKSITGLSLPITSSLKISFKFEGYKRHTNGEVFLLLTSDKHRNKFYAIYKQKSKKASPVKAIAAEIKRFRLSTVLRRLLKVDFSRTPYFGKLEVPDLGLIYSTGKMKIQEKKIFKNSPLLQTTKNMVSKGLSVYMRVPFHHDPLIAKYHNRVLIITTPRRNLRLDRLLQFLLARIGNRHISLPIPNWNRIFRLYIELIRVTKYTVTVVMSFPQPVVFFENFLKLSKVKAEILIQNKRPKVSVKLTGNIHLAGAIFKTELARNRNHKYVLKSIGDRLNVNRLMNQFHAAILPRAMSALLRRLPFLRMNIINPRLYYTFGAKPMQIHIGGIPHIHGYRITNMDLVLVKIRGKVKAALAIKLGTVNLAQMLTQITGFNFRRFFILNQNIRTSITMSPMRIKGVHFAGKLSSLPIAKGISLIAFMKFPRHCGHHKFCKFAGILIGHNNVLSLKATMVSTTYYSIRASLHKLRLGRGLTLYNAGLEIVGGTSSRIGLVGELHLKNPKLVFTARISTGTKGLSLGLSMTGCWYRAFGAHWLDICNINGAIDFVPPKLITGFEIGAQVHLGYRSTRRQLRAKAYLGTSIINPIENYYYARFNSVNMRSLLRAFRINRHLPRPLGDSGFPKGFISSFSAVGKELPQVHVSIPRGFRLKGTLNILGLQGHADITIGLPRGIDIKVALPPIQIGGILKMYASSRDRRRGPYLKAKVQVLPRFNVHIEARGYLQVLGISREARLIITNSKYEFHIRGRVLGLFYAHLHITARYGNIRHAAFHVKGEFKTDLFNSIKRIEANSFKHVANVAHNTINAARGALKHAERIWNHAKGAVGRAWRKMRSLGRGFFTAKIMERCTRKSCRKMAKIGWFRRVVRHFRRHAADLARKALERARRLKERALEKARRLKEIALEKARRLARLAREKALRLFNAAKGAYHHTRNALGAVTHQLNRARHHLNHIRGAYKVGSHLFNFIRGHGLGRIINIQRLWFDVSLKSANHGHFKGGIKLQFLGRHNIHFRVSFNLRHVTQLAKSVFHRVMNRIKHMLG